MLRNYLLIAWRNLRKHKTFSLINVLGLAIGMAACLLILQYVTFQTSFDTFHTHQANLYRVVLGEEVRGRHVTPPALALVIHRELPQVQRVARVQQIAGVVEAGPNLFSEDRLYWVDPAFLVMFSYPLESGNPVTALSRPNTAVVSRSTARKYFGSANPVGKVMQVSNAEEGSRSFEITGVLQDVPQYSHLQFDVLLSYLTPRGEDFEQAWNWRFLSTYVLLAPGTDPRAIETSLAKSVRKTTPEDEQYHSFWLQPLSDIHTSTVIKDSDGADVEVMYFLLLLALFILGIAWINYINLSTARATERAREVGVRKAIGAGRFQLFRQFLLESVLLNALGIALAFTLVQVSLPFFRELTGLNLSLTLWSEWKFWAALTGLFVAGTLLSGIYPALVLSSYHPIVVLKGKNIPKAGNISLRKSLVVVQFVASVILLAGTFTMYRQITFMRNQALGVDIDQVLVVKGPQLVGDSATLAGQWQLFKMQLQGIASAQHITSSSAIPSKGYGNYFNNLSVEGITPKPGKTRTGEARSYGLIEVDADFIQTFGLRLVAGRNFSEKLASDAQSVILNEAAAKQLGFTRSQQALGHLLKRGEEQLTIIGVIKNYHHNYLKEDYSPAVYLLDPTRANYYSIKIAGGPVAANGPATANRIHETISAIERQWKTVYPGNPFDYFFLDDAFNAQYQADRQLGSTIGLFAFLAILVACLGLFGLVSFTTSQRTKEVGIRKVLGAHAWQILLLLSKDFMGLILVANLIAWPLAYWGMEKWLASYAFKIPVTPGLFVLPTLAVLLVAVLTIVVHTRRAARSNPVDSLRYE